MKTTISKLLGITLLLGMGTSLQGCTDDEVATGVGLVAIGAGLVIIGGSDSGRRCEGGYVTRCTSYRDYFGRYREECRREYDSCKRYRSYGNDNMTLLADQFGTDAKTIDLAAVSAAAQPVSRGKWAATFGMSFKSAEYMVSSLEEARAGKAAALLNMGLERRDVELLANEKMPSAKGIDSLARKLNMDQKNAEAMLEALLEEGKELRKKKCRKVGRPGRSTRICRAA